MLDDAKHQALTRRILEIAYAGRHSYVYIHPPALSNEAQVHYTVVEQELVRMEQRQLIAISAFDGSRDKPYQEWPDALSFFNNRTDAGKVRVRLLLEGELLLSNLPKAAIGFGASA